MAVPVRGGQAVLFTGDSLTGAFNWYAVTGGFVDQANALTATYPASMAGGAVASRQGGGSVAATSRAAPLASPIRVLNTGVAGYTTTDVLANIASMITSQTFDIVFLVVGVNDSTSGIPIGTVQSNMTSIITQTQAAKPAAQIVIGSVCWPGTEQWSAGPPLAFTGDPTNPTNPTAINAVYQALCATYGCTYVDFRPTLLAAEQATNTPAPGAVSGVDTSDGKHPNNTGRLHMGNAAIGSFVGAP